MASKIAALVSSLSTLESRLLILLSLQYPLTFLLPSTYAFTTTIALLLGILLTNQFSRKSNLPSLTPEDCVRDVKKGRWTAQPGNTGDTGTKKLAQEGVVCCVVGASSNQYVPSISFLLSSFFSEDQVSKGRTINPPISIETDRASWPKFRENSPLGFQAPGFAEVDKYFTGIWKEAEARRTEWGCKSQLFSNETLHVLLLSSLELISVSIVLGGTVGLHMQTPTGVTGVSLSYWKTVDGLHTFASSPAHRDGWNWWNRNVEQHPHLGIMHEVYAAPPNAWENIYVNFVPFGMGKFCLSFWGGLSPCLLCSTHVPGI
jgi:hypothetical protein